MNLLLALALAELAVFRLSRVVAVDGICDGFRREAGRRSNGSRLWKWIADLIHCPFCLGVWFAILPAVYFAASPTEFVLYWLGLAGGQTLMEIWAQSLLPIE